MTTQKNDRRNPMCKCGALRTADMLCLPVARGGDTVWRSIGRIKTLSGILPDSVWFESAGITFLPRSCAFP